MRARTVVPEPGALDTSSVPPRRAALSRIERRSRSSYPRFHEVMAEGRAQTVVPALTGSILPLVPGLTDRLEAGIDVLDLGCGSVRALNLMARTYPNSRFTGYDISEEGIARAPSRARGLGNVRFEIRDVAELGERDN